MSKLEELERTNAITFGERAEKQSQLEQARNQLSEIDQKIEDLSAQTERDKEVRSSRLVKTDDIIWRFQVKPDEEENKKWWRARISNASRYGLTGCVALKGAPGKGQSLLRPGAVAIWLVEKKHMGRGTVAAILRRHYPDESDAFDSAFPPKSNTA